MESRKISLNQEEIPIYNSRVNEDSGDGAPSAPMTMRRQDMKESLECPICAELIFPPVLDCENGHHLCSLCHSKVEECPICKSVPGVTRNRFAEEFLEKFVARCEFNAAGCRSHFWKEQPELLRSHEESCKFRKIQCWVPNCGHQAFPDGLENHWHNVHGIEAIEDTVNYNFTMNNSLTPYYENKAFHMQHNGNSFLAIFEAASKEARETGVYVYGYCPRDVLPYYQALVTLKVTQEDSSGGITTNTHHWKGPVHHESEYPFEIMKNERNFHEFLPTNGKSTQDHCTLTISITASSMTETVEA